MKNLVATGNIYGEAITIKQVSKAAAIKHFTAGNPVYLQSSNMSPFNHWQSVYSIQLDEQDIKSAIEHNNFCINLYSEQVDLCNNSGEEWRKPLLADYEEKLNTHKTKVINAASQFNLIVNEYSYYNCDNERGKYVHFYIKQS